MRRPLSLLLFGLTATAACGDSDSNATIAFVTVDDPFTGPPAATTLNVDSIDADTGAVTSLVKGASISNATIDLGDLDSSEIVSLRATAFDAAGVEVAWGQTIATEVGDMVDTTTDLFIERTGTLSRMPNPLSYAWSAPFVGVVASEYIFLVQSGTGATNPPTNPPSQIYDLGGWSPVSEPPTLPNVPLSIAVSALQILSLNATGAEWLDLSSGDLTTATLPTGGPGWADVAGGQTVVSPDDGTAYIIGGTRPTNPTSAVLVISSSQALSFASLTTSRAGAAAGWVEGVGVVIAGGSATGAGAEVLGSGATAATALPYPPDPTTGGGIDALDDSHALVATGTSARVLDLGCGTSCTATAWTVPIPESLSPAQVFGLDALTALVIGDDASGTTHAVRMTASTATEVPFRVTRSHARGVRLPMGNVAVVGGDVTIEAYED